MMTATKYVSSILFTAPVSEEIRNVLTERGMDVHVQPFITATYPEASRWRSEIPSDYDTWVFTSKRAVKAVKKVINELTLPLHVFAVGTETAKKLEDLSLQPIIPHEYNLIALSKKMNGYPIKKVIHFCGNRKAGDLSSMLTGKNIKFHPIEVYQTALNPVEINTSFYSGFVFMSPSAVEAFYTKNAVPENAVIYSIGPSTTRALESKNVKHIIQARESTKSSLALTIQKNN